MFSGLLLRDMRVVVTGGSGFLGGYVIPALVRKGFEVHALARSREASAIVSRLGAVALPGDLDVPASIVAAFGSAQAGLLVNLASLGFGHAPNIVQAAETAGFERAVFVSTTSIFTMLDSSSKEVRIAAERSIRESRLSWTIFRPTMIYGAAGDRNLARLIRILTRTSLVPVPGGGQGKVQPVHVQDLAEVIVASTDVPEAAGQTFDIAGPDPMTLRELIEETARAVGKKVRVVWVPLRPSVWAVRVYERLSGSPSLKAEQLLRLAEDKVFDISPARRYFGYAPRSFSEGIRQEAQVVL